MVTRTLEIVTTDAFEWSVASALARHIRSLADRQTISIALSGGRTPRQVYRAFATLSDLPWDKLRVYFTDERGVPPDARASNYGLAWSELCEPVGMSREQVFRMEADDADPSAAARRYADALPDTLDIALVGFGDDGHVASVFPSMPDLWTAGDKVRVVEGKGGHAVRLTLSPEYLAATSHVVVMGTGKKKSAAARRALEGNEPFEQCPARIVGDRQWILDFAAAAELRNFS